MTALDTESPSRSRAPGYLGTPRLGLRRPSGPRPGTAQPWLGLAGLAVIIPVGVVLAVCLGDIGDSAVVLGPITTFALPAIGTIAFWWEDWPGANLRAGWAGLTDTLLIAAAGVALTALGQVIVNGTDLHGVLLPRPGPGHPATYPATMALAGAAFAAILQLTLVTEGWPLRGRVRIGRIFAGVKAFVLSWLIALAAWLLVVRPGPLGHVERENFGAWLIVLGAWQTVFYIVLRGKPFTLITGKAARLVTANAVLLALTAVTFAGLRAAGVERGVLTACGGAVVGAGLVVAMLFDGWPARRLSPVAGNVVNLLSVAVVAAALYLMLRAVAATVSPHGISETSWATLAALNFVGMVVILHVVVWRRWPVIAQPRPSSRHSYDQTTEGGQQ